MKNDISTLKEENSKLSDALLQQQQFLESLDAERRRNKFIVFGVPETDLNDGTDNRAATDQEKINMILQKIDCGDIPTAAVRRLGQYDPTKTRPVEVTLVNAAKRSDVIDKAKKLKELALPFSDMGIRKDSHPAVRREWRRLKEAEEREKKRPENQGKTISIDYRKRILKVDDIIIDRFGLLFFQNKAQN